MKLPCWILIKHVMTFNQKDDHRKEIEDSVLSGFSVFLFAQRQSVSSIEFLRFIGDPLTQSVVWFFGKKSKKKS